MNKAMALFCAAGLLAGCSSPPNDEDLRSALKGQMEAVAGKTGMSMFSDSIKQAKIIGCAKSDAGGYKCDFTGMMGVAQSGRLVNSKDGWILVMGN